MPYKDPEKAREAARKYRAANREKARETARQYRAKVTILLCQLSLQP